MLAHLDSRSRHQFRTFLLLPTALLLLSAGFSLVWTDIPQDEAVSPPAWDDNGLPPFLSAGAKVGELTPNSALIQTYLLSQPADVLLEQPYRERDYSPRPGGVSAEYSISALPELSSALLTPAEFKQYQEEQAAGAFTPWMKIPRPAASEASAFNPREREWLEAARATDYSAHITLKSLEPGTPYSFRLWTKATVTGLVRPGPLQHFTTPPAPEDARDVSFIATTCFNHGRLKDLEDGVWPVRGFRLHRALLELVDSGKLAFDFAVTNGDTVYLDKQGTAYRQRPEFEMNGMRARFLDTYLLPLTRAFFRRFPAYFLKDDHDWRFNDADPVFNPAAPLPRSYRLLRKFYRGLPGPSLGKEIFEEMHPVARAPGAVPYRTFRWGRGLQVWLLEMRECRYPNGRVLGKYEIKDLAVDGEPDNPYLYYPDYCGTPTADQAWGKKQFDWLVRTLKASDAAFKIIISPTPVLGPDQNYHPEISLRPLRRKADNHVRRFRAEFAEFLAKLQEEEIKNVYFVSGDRHFVWHSRYQTQDSQFTLHEFGSGVFADDIVPFGDVFYRDRRGRARLVAAQARAGFVHVQVKDVAGNPTLRVEWYLLENWKTARVRRWEHSFEAPAQPPP